MSQSALVLATLKKQLKAHGMTYAKIAKHLALSEATIKRAFAEGSFSLQRLESICALIGFQISDIVNLMEREQPHLEELSIAQEQEIADDEKLLIAAVSVLNGFTFQDLLQIYTFSETELIRKLAQLDRLKLIDLLPNNRIKLLVAPNFRWIQNGPIQRFFLQKIESDFFQSKFNQTYEKLLVVNAMLSPESIAELQRKMDALARSFNQLQQDDFSLPNHKKQPVTAIFAERSWRVPFLDKYRRSNL